MISFFRRLFASKIGLAIAMAFLALMALAFAASDITGRTFGGIASTDRMAVVGSKSIAISDLTTSANNALAQVRQQNPTLTMPEFIAQGGLDEVTKQLIDRFAVGEYARKYGLRAGKNLVDSEILKIPAFQGLTGAFDEKTYVAALGQRGLTDKLFRRDLGDELLAQQMLTPALAVPQLPEKIARQYASLVLEKRKGLIALIPSASYAPAGDPTDAQLTAWYAENRTQFIRPERRTLRFAVLSADGLQVNATPTAAEIAARFQKDAALYAASEKRAITSFVVPTKDAASALAARISGGAALESVAREAGFTTSKSGPSDQKALASSTSAAFAQNVFKAGQGAVVTPAQGALGWYVARVDKIERIAARSLAQATPEITQALAAEKRTAAIADRIAEIEGEVDSGTALADVAKANGLKVETTPPLLADGTVYGTPGAKIVPQLAPVLQTAFQMEESEPQLAEVVQGKDYVIFEVARVEEAAAAPLAEVRPAAVAAWKRAQGSVLAKQAADRILAKVRGGMTLDAALAAENKSGFERQPIDLERRQLLAQGQNQRIPPPLVLMFSMAKGTVKSLEGPRNAGWYVVSLENITTLPLDKEQGLIAQTRQQLGGALADEYRQQATVAMRKELGVTQNAEAIAAVRKRLAGDQ